MLPPYSSREPLPWIRVAPSASYFEDETGAAWTPIGQNDAITWPDLAGAFRRRDLPSVEGHLRWLRGHGVTCLRLMLEYCHGEHRYFERPVGTFAPNMVRMWDDIFALCEAHGLRILLTPYDTFWMWLRWDKHPYNRKHGGPCVHRSRWLLNPEMREAIKNRLYFATERWGKSGTLFAWDIWNEIHPAHAEKSSEVFHEFVADISEFLRATELRLHGRAHPQTVSIFGPVLFEDSHTGETIFRHPSLDFCNSHFYEKDTIDHPHNTVDAARSVGKLTRQALTEIRDGRPFFDSEHGPIHSFKDKRTILPEPFDDEYFRHIQWAHFASGGAGGGMRWPNRHPHTLTHGMRRAQAALVGFLPLIEWSTFQRRNLNAEVNLSHPDFASFACADGTQAIVWLLRTRPLNAQGFVRTDLPATNIEVQIPGMNAGRYQVTAWDTVAGRTIATFEAECAAGELLRFATPPICADVALAVRRIP